MLKTIASFAIFLLLFSPYVVVVTSNSMYPTLKTGDLVILSHREPRVGDVVVYEHGDILIIHRLIAIKDGKLITKGDNPETNPLPDPRDVYPQDVVGVAVLRIPYVGYAVLLLKSYPRLFLPLFVLALFYDRILPEIRRDRRKIRALIAFSLLLLLLRLHPWSSERAYLISREYQQSGPNEFYVSVLFFSSGDRAVIIEVITSAGRYTFERHPIYPGTAGERSIGMYVEGYPEAVHVWKTRSLSGEKSTSKEASL